MKIFKVTLSVILLSLMFLLGLKIYRNFNISRDLKDEKKTKLKESAAVLNECLDFKNKSQRTINNSLKLIEYCLEKYGFEK